MAQQPIQAANIPVPGLFADVLSADAGFLRADAGKVRSSGSAVRSTWAGLSASYDAPEAAGLFSVMDAVVSTTDSFATSVEAVASALETFAAEAGPLQSTLQQAQSDAYSFDAKVAGEDDWDHHQDLVDQNNNLIHTVNSTLVAYEAAERKCANAIEALFGGQQFHAIKSQADEKDPYAYGFDSIPDDAKTPWGAKVEKQDGCVKSALHATGQFFVGVGSAAWGMVKGLGDLTGLGGWDAFKQSWEGMGFLATLIVPGGTSVGMAIWGPKGYLDRVEAFGQGLLDWNEWSSDPGKALGTVVTNIGTLFIPGADGAAAAGDVAKGAELAADAGRAADLASDAGRASSLLDYGKLAVNNLGKFVDPLTYVRGLPKVLDIARDFKVNVGADLGDFGKGDNLAKDMAGWTDHGDPGEGAHPADPGVGPGVHDPGTAPSAPDLPPGLAHQSFESPHGYGPDTQVMQSGDSPVAFGTKNSNQLGQIGEQLTEQDLRDRGYTILTDHVQIKIPGTSKYFVPDFIARAPDGDVVLVESKIGPGAHFTPNQLDGYQAYSNHVPLEARSPSRAEELEQLTRNQPVSSVEVYRWNTEIKPTEQLLQQTGLKP